MIMDALHIEKKLEQLSPKQLDSIHDLAWDVFVRVPCWNGKIVPGASRRKLAIAIAKLLQVVEGEMP